MKRFSLSITIPVLCAIVMSIAVSAALQRPVNIADIRALSNKATVTATYREVDAEKGVFALDFAIANSDFYYLGLYLGYDETAIVTCQPDGSDATGLKKRKALVVATKTLDGLDDPVAIDDAEYGWGAFTAKAFDPANGTISLGLGLGLQADEVLEAHGLVNRIMPKTAEPYGVYTVYFKTVGDTTLDDVASELFTPLEHIVEPWNGATIFVDAETTVDVPITFVGLPVQPEPPKAENLKGTPMLGNNIDDIIGEGLGGYDAGKHIAQFFSVTQEGTIPQIRYYFPKDFLTQYKIDEYTFDFVFKLYERSTARELNSCSVTATITEADLGWYVFDLPKSFAVKPDIIYGVTVFKGVNGYTGVGDSNEGDFEGMINSPFERPTDGFGAWSNYIDRMPDNSYKLLGGRHWGTDPVYSEEIIESDEADFTYTINADNVTATITGYTGPTDANINIPSEIDGYTVTVIGDSAFADRSDLTGKLTIPDTVTTIGEDAFCGCYRFTGDLIIPDSVTSIGNFAFSGCSGFTGALVIPDSVTTIGNYAFRECYGFIGDLVIPDSVTSIGDSAFLDCIGFTGGLFIGNNVTTIGDSAFSECYNFKDKLIIGCSVTTIGDNAFRGCSGFNGSLLIPDTVSSIGEEAFVYCCITEFIVGNDNPNYSSDEYGVLFNKDKTMLIQYPCGSTRSYYDIPDSVTTIGNAAFMFCSGIEKANIYNKTITFGKDVFTGVSSDFEIHGYSGSTTEAYANANNHTFVALVDETSYYKYTVNADNETATITGYTGPVDSDINIPSEIDGYTVTVIGDSAFADRNDLTGKLTIPDSVTTIERYAFDGCKNLTGEITFSENFVSIGRYAFSDCKKIEKVHFKGNVPSIWSTRAFYGNSDNFTIYYEFGKSGWSTPTWTAPDGNIYNTFALNAVSVSFAGKLCAFMDSLYIRYYFNTDADSENINYMGTLLMSKKDFESGKYTELTLDNASTNLIANNTADDQYASLGNFALQTVYAKDINTVYKVRPYLVLKDGTVVYGETEEYGLCVYLNNQLNKPEATAIYKKLLSFILEYGNVMDAYVNRFSDEYSSDEYEWAVVNSVNGTYYGATYLPMTVYHNGVLTTINVSSINGTDITLVTTNNHPMKGDLVKIAPIAPTIDNNAATYNIVTTGINYNYTALATRYFKIENSLAGVYTGNVSGIVANIDSTFNPLCLNDNTLVVVNDGTTITSARATNTTAVDLVLNSGAKIFYETDATTGYVKFLYINGSNIQSSTSTLTGIADTVLYINAGTTAQNISQTIDNPLTPANDPTLFAPVNAIDVSTGSSIIVWVPVSTTVSTTFANGGYYRVRIISTGAYSGNYVMDTTPLPAGTSITLVNGETFTMGATATYSPAAQGVVRVNGVDARYTNVRVYYMSNNSIVPVSQGNSNAGDYSNVANVDTSKTVDVFINKVTNTITIICKI